MRQQGQKRVRTLGRFLVQPEGGSHLQTQRVPGGIDGVLEHFPQVERAVHRCGNGVQDFQLARTFAHAPLQRLVGLLQLRLGPAPLGQLLLEGGVQPGVVQGNGGQLGKADHLVQLLLLEGRGTGGAGNADDAGDLASRLERNPQGGAQRVIRETRRVPIPAAVVLHHHRLCCLPDLACEPFAAAQHRALQARKGRGVVPALNHLTARPGKVDEGGVAARQPLGTFDQSLQKGLQIEIAHDAESGLVQCSEVFALAAAPHSLPVARWGSTPCGAPRRSVVSLLLGHTVALGGWFRANYSTSASLRN